MRGLFIKIMSFFIFFYCANLTAATTQKNLNDVLLQRNVPDQYRTTTAISSNTNYQPADDQTSRLRISNQCPYKIYIQQNFSNKTNDPIVVAIEPKGYYDFNISSIAKDLQFWPKAGNCNQYGYNCAIGESVLVPEAVNAGQQSSSQSLMPDINTKFKITFDDKITYFNASTIDGYTFAFQIKIKAPADQNIRCFYTPYKKELITTNVPAGKSLLYLDCSRLDPSRYCPDKENLSLSLYRYSTSRESSYNNVPLDAVNMKYQQRGMNTVIGCFSPCAKLTFPQTDEWSKQLGKIDPNHPVAKMFCCAGMTQDECRSGPAAQTAYLHSVQDVRKGACNAYAYATDDEKGNMVCDAKTKYEIVICPNGNSLPIPAPAKY